jgi:hypothetical protein
MHKPLFASLGYVRDTCLCRFGHKAATPKFEVKRGEASDCSNDCGAVSLGGYSASNFAGSAINTSLLLDSGVLGFHAVHKSQLIYKVIEKEGL